ncbi:TIR domain-containing protein [Sorangium sp. So ce1036]|uniref:TIR domain-containing protein n=1 Tax=Sorangium sp. So ce1036 TaxID=3133328 RepID=UPI003F090F32
MITSQATDIRLCFVSTFLSHASSDKPFVEAVAKHLARRGVLAWLDKEELALGPLDTALKQAVQRQATMTLFLSDAYLASDWCRDELRWAIEATEGVEHLLPVYLGDPLKLVRQHERLRTRFLHPDGDKVNQLGSFDKNNPLSPDPEAVAEKIAAAAYRRTIPAAWSEIAIVLDQRGNGPRRGPPPVPANVASLDIPALAFRPSLMPREQRELLSGADWQHAAQSLTWALSTALGTLRGDPRKVRVLGDAQTGLVWAVGRHLNRTTSVDLYGYDRNGLPATNRGQVRHTPIPGGDPACVKHVSGPLLPAQPVVALGVGSAARYAPLAQQAVPGTPLMWIESGFIADSDQAMKLVADIVAAVERLRHEHGVREVVLFWATANHVALLASANLTPHVIPQVRTMEWDHHAGSYLELPMP